MESSLELWKSAVCPGDVPPLQHGEHMTVGQVRHPDLQRAFAAESSKWFLSVKRACKRWKTQKKLADTAVPHLLSLVNPTLTKKVVSNTTAAIAERLGWDKVTCGQLKSMLESCTQPEQALRLLLRNSRSHPATRAAEAAIKQQEKQDKSTQQQKSQTKAAAAPGSSASDSDEDSEGDSDGEDAESEWERKHSWLALPRDVPVKGVRAGVVPETDPRGPLRGQKGIWAVEDLPEGHLIGPYRHYCMYTKAFDAILKTKPSHWQGPPSSWKLQLDSYACNDTTGEVGVVEVSPNEEAHAPPGKYSLIFSGFGLGNETAYANDPHLDPVTHLTMPGMPDEYLGPHIPDPASGKELPGSAQICHVSICGWAYAFMITILPLRKDYEVLYDYGHSYWAFAAESYHACNKEKEEQQMFEEQQAKLQALTEQLRAATQASSGLTLSLNNTSVHPASTQDVSQTAAAQAAPKAPMSQGAPAESGFGSCGPHSGVSDMRQQLHGMQLAQDSSARRDGSGGGSMGSAAGVGASVAQQGQHNLRQLQHRHEQDQGQQQEQGDRLGRENGPARSAGEAAASTGAVAATASKCESPVEEQDDACSALLRSVRGYAGLQFTEQQLEVLQRSQQLAHERQHVTQAKDAAGNLQQVQRIDDPDVEQMIQDVQMALSHELILYPNGIAFSKLKSTWWDKFRAVKNYYCDKWDFIVRHSQLYELSEKHFSRNTKIHLTAEWREALEAQMEAEGRPVIRQQQYSSNKRKRGEITRTEVQVIRDDAAERQLRKQLQQKDGELQEARDQIRQLERDVQQLIVLAQDARLQVPPQLLKSQWQLLAAARGGGGSRGGVARSKADQRRRSSSRSRSRGRSGGDRRDSRDRYRDSGKHNSRRSSRSRSRSRNGASRRDSRDRYRDSGKHNGRSSRSRSRSRNGARQGSRDRYRTIDRNGSRRSSRSRSRRRSSSRCRSRGGAAWRSHSSRDRAPACTASPPTAAARSQPPAIDPSLFDVASAPLAALHGGGGDSDSRSETPDGLLGHDSSDSSDSDEELGGQGPGRVAAAAGGSVAAAGAVNGREAAGSRAGHASGQSRVQPASGYAGARGVDRDGRDGDRSRLDRGYNSSSSGYRQQIGSKGQQRGGQGQGGRDADRGRESDRVQGDRQGGGASKEADRSKGYSAAGSRYSSSGKAGQYRRP